MCRDRRGDGLSDGLPRLCCDILPCRALPYPTRRREGDRERVAVESILPEFIAGEGALLSLRMGLRETPEVRWGALGLPSL